MEDAAQIIVRWISNLLPVISSLLLVAGCHFDSNDTTQPSSISTPEFKNSTRDHTPQHGKLSAKDPIVVAFGDRYEPFAWGDGLAVKGVQVDFVKEILVKRMGRKVVCQGCPWKRCQDLVRKGEMDGFFTVPTRERAEFTVKSVLPFYETHFVMHVSKSNPIANELRRVSSLNDLERLHNIRHIHMHGSGWHENALGNMKTVFTVPNASVIPMMLVLNRADVYIEQAEMFRYQARSIGVSDEVLTIDQPSIEKVGWHLFIGKRSKHSSIIPELNKKLKSLKATGELERIKQEIFKKYGI